MQNASKERKQLYKARANDYRLATGKHRLNSLFLWNQIGMKKAHVVLAIAIDNLCLLTNTQCMRTYVYTNWNRQTNVSVNFHSAKLTVDSFQFRTLLQIMSTHKFILLLVNKIIMFHLKFYILD